MTATNVFTVDTNILIYSMDRSDPIKQTSAGIILRFLYARRFPLPLQALSEFHRAVVGKRILSSTESSVFIHDAVHQASIVPHITTDLFSAIETHRATGHQFFDCLLLATASRVGCTIFFSEDFQHGRTYGGLQVLNPFLLSSDRLGEILS